VTTPRIAVILNPKARNGQAARIVESVRHSWTPPVQVFETRAPEHATELTRAALRAGATTIVAAGGDGTINEVANGFFEDGVAIAPDAAIGVIPYGTGSDFRRSLDFPADTRIAAQLINANVSMPIDVMKVAYTAPSGSMRTRYAVNVVSFGLGGAVAARARVSSKALGGKAGFLFATLRAMAGFKGNRVRIVMDHEKAIERDVTNVAVGNGRFHGGGMWVCPRAVFDDGLLDVTIIRYLSLFETIRDLKMLYNGRIYEHPKVEFHRAKRVRGESDDLAPVEIDGEPLGRLPLEIEVIPKAVRFIHDGSKFA
jgi:YegS/Rv2252/BmrU family lipid kinase